MRRALITGIGIVSPLGRAHADVVRALREGRSGVRRIEHFDASPLECRIGGEVPPDATGALSKRLDRFASFAVTAAGDALAHAALDPRSLDGERFGVIVGTGLGGAESLDGGYRRIYKDDAPRIPPASIAMSMYNAAASAVSAHAGARGVTYSVVSACASSAHAVGQAMQAIRRGDADVILAGGADAPLALGIIRAWESMRVLAIDNERPEAACRPFSADRKGLVLAEGAAMFVVESEEHARSRGAAPAGEIAGFGITSDAGHVTDPSAESAARAMTMALRDAGVDASDVGYVNAHGTATRANDAAETAAIKLALGEAARAVPVSSTKSLHGHAMGASGAIEIACSLLALNDGFLPPTINLATADPECDLDYVPNAARDGRAALFLSNSFGFGGMNGVVAVRTVHGL